jgi:hypothetical protein
MDCVLIGIPIKLDPGVRVASTADLYATNPPTNRLQLKTFMV